MRQSKTGYASRRMIPIFIKFSRDISLRAGALQFLELFHGVPGTVILVFWLEVLFHDPIQESPVILQQIPDLGGQLLKFSGTFRFFLHQRTFFSAFSYKASYSPAEYSQE